MKKIKIICMLIVSIMIGASALASVNASEIDSGSLDVTINDDLWGTVSPEINIPDETSITLEATKINDTVYEVNDNMSIPLNIFCNKDKVLFHKHILPIYVAFKDNNPKIMYIPNNISLKHPGVTVHDGSIFYNGEIPDGLTTMANYNISAETFSTGEEMKLLVFAIGVLPGEGSPHQLSLDIGEMVENLPEDKLIIRLIKEFLLLDFEIGIDLSSFAILSMKLVDLNISYELGSAEQGYNLDLSVVEGNGTIQASPSKSIYKHDIKVTLTAVPDPGYIFQSWSGDQSGSENPVNITMDSNKTVSAHFIKEPVLISPVTVIGRFGLGLKLSILNQEDTNITDITWNITTTGGLLPGILGTTVTSSNGTIDDISPDESITIQGPKARLLGKTDIKVTLDLPGYGVIEKEYNGVSNLLGLLVIYPN